MEDVLEVYTRPDDPRRPLVCLDETSTQVLRDTRASQWPAPGRPAHVDYEYEWEGGMNRFLCGEPLAGQRWVDVTAQRRTRIGRSVFVRYSRFPLTMTAKYKCVRLKKTATEMMSCGQPC